MARFIEGQDTTLEKDHHTMVEDDEKIAKRKQEKLRL
jgi:hypothetical protein